MSAITRGNEESYKKAVKIFMGECENWCNEGLLDRCNGDYEKAITIMCNTMEGFGVHTERIKNMPINLSADRIQEVIAELSPKYTFRYVCVKPGEDTFQEWVLKKGIRALSIEFKKDRYIFIDSLFGSWSMISYDYYDLETAIRDWAERYCME